MISIHNLEEGDGAERPDGVRGYVASNTALYFTVQWEDGTTTEYERGDPGLLGFYFPESQGVPTGRLFHQVRHDWRQWRIAGPRPHVPPRNVVIPIAADASGHYGYPKGSDA